MFIFLHSTMLHTRQVSDLIKPPTLTALVAASSLLFISGCGQSSAPETASQAQTPAVAQVPAAAPETSAPPALTAVPVPAAPAAPLAVAPLPKSDRLVIQGFASPLPPSWTAVQPSSSMRVAQFVLPAAAGAEAGELAAFFFPTGQGGSHDANIERWTSQFVSADGKPVAPKISASKNGEIAVTLVELQGTYARGVGMGPAGDAKPNQTLLVALVETSVGRITLQTYGPSKTIAAQRDNFVKFAKDFRPA